LEIFPWSTRYHSIKDSLISYQAPWEHHIPFSTNEDSIVDQFTTIKNIFLQSWYERYEISNYALPGQESIHNNVYWSMWAYLWIGLWAHGCLYDNAWKYNRIHCNVGWKKFIEQKWEDSYVFTPMDQKDYSIEAFFLWLRTRTWIVDYSTFSHVLKENSIELFRKLIDEWLLMMDGKRIYLTDKGMDIHHQVCLYLMNEI
jgi:oxygen-independent coproporphyrinogen-3 oxidase